MEVKTSMTTCPNGHHYDAARYGSCPFCAGDFSAAEPSNGYGPEYPNDPFDVPTTRGGDLEGFGGTDPVVGWLVCTEGPARGQDFRIHAGYNYIGRDTGDIRIPGDTQISRQNHAMVAFDSGENLFFVGPATGRNLIKVNGKPAFGAVEVHNYDTISIGSTRLVFIGLCGPQFSWGRKEDSHA